MLFGHVKPTHTITVHIEGCRVRATVDHIVTRIIEVDGVLKAVPVAVTRGNLQFRLDTGVALIPPKAWLIQRLTPVQAKRSRLPWAHGEQPE